MRISGPTAALLLVLLTATPPAAALGRKLSLDQLVESRPPRLWTPPTP